MVEDILDHSKIEAGVFEIEESRFKFNDLFKEIENIFGLQVRNKNLSLYFEVEEELKHLKFQSDKQRLKQIMLNLLSNSLKFTDRGFIKVSLSLYKEDDIGCSISHEEPTQSNSGSYMIEANEELGFSNV